jgi:L-aspartate oxidase
MTYEYDYLVLGSGIAGLVFALQAANKGKVAVVTKRGLNDCNTEYAQGGIAAVLDAGDSFAEHIEDTFTAGAELGKKQVIRQIIEQGPKLIQYLVNLGTDFTRRDDSYDQRLENLSLTMEGGHSHRRVAYAADSTGHQILEALIHQCKSNPNIDIYENTPCHRSDHPASCDKRRWFIPGVSMLGRLRPWIPPAIIVDIFKAAKPCWLLAEQLRSTSTTPIPRIATGDGMAMANRAGARLANMEFVQFHPTAFWSPEGDTFLISEAVRGEGAQLRLSDGSSFIGKQNYQPKGNLAPRDIVIPRHRQRIETSRERNTAGSMPPKCPETSSRKHIPYIDSRCEETRDRLYREPIPVAPAAH